MALTIFNRGSAPVRNDELWSLQSGINRIFDDFWGDFSGLENKLEHLQTSIDLSETENEIKVSAELAGMKKEDLDISFSDGYLHIKGEKKSEKEEKEKNSYISERHYGMIQRSVPIGRDVDVNKAEAKFEDGVLKVSIPKTEDSQSKVKKIEVK